MQEQSACGDTMQCRATNLWGQVGIEEGPQVCKSPDLCRQRRSMKGGAQLGPHRAGFHAGGPPSAETIQATDPKSRADDLQIHGPAKSASALEGRNWYASYK